MNRPDTTASDPSDVSDVSSDAENQSVSDSDNEHKVSTENVCKMLIKALVRCPSSYAEVNLSLSKICNHGSRETLTTCLVFLETNFSLRPNERLLIYESLADSVVPYLDQGAESIPPSRIRSFILRLVSDLEKMSSIEADTDRIALPVSKMVNVIASVAMLSFGDLTVDVLMTSEFVYGKPTIQNVTVQEALIDIFKNRVTADVLTPTLHAVMVKLANVPPFAINYPVISAIARGIHRCFPTVPENSQSLLPIILDTVLSSSGGEISTDSLESILLLVSLGESASSLSILPQLSQAVLTIGTKGLETEDLRELFLICVEIIWTRQVPLFENDMNDLFNLILSINQVDDSSLKIWQLTSPVVDATNYLCECASSFTNKTEILYGETAIRALTQVAIAQQHNLSPRIFDLIESMILTSQEKSFPISPRGLILILDLVTEIDAGLLNDHPLIVQFMLRMVMNPSAVISEKFPAGFPSNDLAELRQAGARALVSLCARLQDAVGAEPVVDLLQQFLESLEHMPSRGVGIICRCISSLLSSGERVSLDIPEAQAIVVTIWLLVSLHVDHPDTDELRDDLPEDIVSGYSTIAELTGSNVIDDEIFSSEKISTQFAKFIDSYPTSDREIFLTNCLDSVIAILSASTTIPRVRVLLIQICSVIVRELPGPISLVTIKQILDLHDVITCSPECIATAGKILGEVMVEHTDSVALVEIFRERFEASGAQLDQLGGAQSFLLNTIRLSKKSLRGLFASDATEKQIKTLIRLREILLIVLSASDENEWITETLLDELEREHDAIIASSTTISSSPVFETTKIILESISAYLVKTEHADDIVYALESCVGMLKAVGGSSPLAGSLFTCLASLLAAENVSTNQPIEISSELFSQVLESTLQAIVETVPDNALLLNSLSTESQLLTERCNEAALVMKSLFHQTSLSWVGLNRLSKAIYALGGGGALPLIRWVCVRIISIVIDDGGLVETDKDVHELLDIVAILIGRLDDSYSPVRLEANRAVHNLLLRWKLTSEELKGEEHSVMTTSSMISSILTRKIPAQYVSAFLLGLISNIHDLDPDAAYGTVTTIHRFLETRSGEIFEDENSAADAVVDAIMLHSSAFPSPPAPPSHWPEVQSRLVGTLRFIAAVRFHIAIKDLLTPLDDKSTNFSIDKIHAIRSFILEKKTLAFFVKELIVRLNSSDPSGGRTACIALGHLLDCYTDSSVSNIATKNFAELYCSLLVHLWYVRDGGDEVRVVIQKLVRAAGNSAVGESVSTDNGLVIFRNSDKILESASKFLAPFLRKNKLVPHTILVSQLVGVTSAIDIVFLDYFENQCENFNGENSIETVHSLRGLERIVTRWAADRDCLEDTDSHVIRILSFLNNLIVANDEQVCHESLHTILKCLDLAVGEIRQYMIHPILGQLRRVVDHSSEQVRKTAFDLIGGICDLMGQEDEDESSVVEFYRSISDLWIPCVVRTQDPASADLRQSALRAFTSILNNAVREIPDETVLVDGDPSKHYLQILDVVRTEIGECSFVHLNACCYYLLGLPSVSKEVRVAGAKLVPVILSMIPEPSTEVSASVIAVLNSMLSSGLEGVFDVVADILIEAKRIEVVTDPENSSSNRNIAVM